VSLQLPAEIEEYGTDWTKSAVYCIEYAKPDNPTGAVDQQYDTRPPWCESFIAAHRVLYCGEATTLIRRLEDHANQDKRMTVLSRIGCEPTSVEYVEYHDSKEAAEAAEYNVAVKLNRQTDNGTLVICNGSAIGDE